MLVVFLFPIENFIVAWQIAFVCIWFGAAASKLNRHFPFVVAVMISNTPWNRSRKAKAQLYNDHPRTCAPRAQAALAAHLGTVMEFGLPFLLLVTQRRDDRDDRGVGMVIFHVHITSTFPLAVPLEWNLFMIFGLLFLFGAVRRRAVVDGRQPAPDRDRDRQRRRSSRSSGTCARTRISFLPSMRYYAGNWATSRGCSARTASAEETLRQPDRQVGADRRRAAHPPLRPRHRRARYCTRRWRSARCTRHGRALNGLLPRAVDDVEAYHVREGEFLADVVDGWNFGDGHFHNEQLLDAVQERCHFKPGRPARGDCSSPSPRTSSASATGSTTPRTGCSRRAT